MESPDLIRRWKLIEGYNVILEHIEDSDVHDYQLLFLTKLIKNNGNLIHL